MDDHINNAFDRCRQFSLLLKAENKERKAKRDCFYSNHQIFTEIFLPWNYQLLSIREVTNLLQKQYQIYLKCHWGFKKSKQRGWRQFYTTSWIVLCALDGLRDRPSCLSCLWCLQRNKLIDQNQCLSLDLPEQFTDIYVSNLKFLSFYLVSLVLACMFSSFYSLSPLLVQGRH